MHFSEIVREDILQVISCPYKGSGCFDRRSPASPLHELAFTIWQGVCTEGFDAEPPPRESGRTRSSLLIQQNEDSGPHLRFATG